MFGMDVPFIIVLVAIISSVLYFILGWKKKQAYWCWSVTGFVICIPIIILVLPVEKILFGTNNFIQRKDDITNKAILFTIFYSILYISLWVFIKKRERTEAEINREVKVDEAIFDGFLALKEKRVEDAYNIFRRGYVHDPDNPVLKTILASFQKGKYGLIKKNTFADWKYKILLSLKPKKKKDMDSHSESITQQIELQSENMDDSTTEKKVEGDVIE